MDAALRKTLDDLPAEPGCYLMKDRQGEVVYVGKAASLRARVRQYFDRGGSDDRIFVPLLEDLLGDIEVIVTRSEKEAVLLENELIKKHRPRFNVRLRDDKDGSRSGGRARSGTRARATSARTPRPPPSARRSGS
jgi:excinuclease ABC subunit C